VIVHGRRGGGGGDEGRKYRTPPEPRTVRVTAGTAGLVSAIYNGSISKEPTVPTAVLVCVRPGVYQVTAPAKPVPAPTSVTSL
jgi:hypothetical protein